MRMTTKHMHIGLDFDNTIVCYDKAIAQLAEELFALPAELPRTKLALRDFLRSVDREADWTAFQGELYGPGMLYAEPFEGAVSTMHQLMAEGHHLMIVSHRSRRPYAGPPHDLHAAARGWVADRLQNAGLFGAAGDGAQVHFLESRDQKLAMISQLGCEAFLDDLPEVLTAPGFPESTKAILFDPAAAFTTRDLSNTTVISSWAQLPLQLACR